MTVKLIEPAKLQVKFGDSLDLKFLIENGTGDEVVALFDEHRNFIAEVKSETAYTLIPALISEHTSEENLIAIFYYRIGLKHKFLSKTMKLEL